MPFTKFPVVPHAENEEDFTWMGAALEQARLAEEAGEVPIGAVLVIGGRAVAAAHNSPVSENNPCAHAELLAIQRACKAVGNYRLGPQATLYVSLQPCLMCLGAILHARIGRVVLGCAESRYNNDLQTSLDLFGQASAWHACRFETGCRAAESETLLSGFFRSRRRQREQSVSEMASLLHLPNANRETVAELASLGFVSPADFLQEGLVNAVEFLTRHAEVLEKAGRNQQAAIFLSLADYLRGEPVQSWKNYLKG